MILSNFLTAMPSATEIGLIYAIVALGVYLTFRVLDFPDLTVDGSFTTGGATAAAAITNGIPPVIAMLLAFCAGAVAGSITGLLTTKGKINGLLASIIVMIALYSINLRIMGSKAALPILGDDTIFTPLENEGWMRKSWIGALIMGAFIALLCAVLIWFLHTRLGLALRATGDNGQMAGSFRISTDGKKILGLAISNALVALAGSLLAQYQGGADATMGIGVIVIGLASVIVGQAVFGQRRVWQAVIAAALGALLYRWIMQIAMSGGLQVQDMKLASAVIVVIALLLPRIGLIKRFKNARRARREDDVEAGLPDDVDDGAAGPDGPGGGGRSAGAAGAGHAGVASARGAGSQDAAEDKTLEGNHA